MKYLTLIFLILFPLIVKTNDSSVIVLMYHRFNHEKYSETSITAETFKKQIQYLIDKKINILPMSELVYFLNENKKIPDGSVFITIDDAYKSFYEYGFPILKEFKLPFSVFVSSDYVSDIDSSDYMSWEMLRDIVNNNGLILNHSKSHKSFLELELNELKEDIEKNQQIIDKNLGLQPKIFSYPYGESNLNIEDIVQKLDYHIAFSQHSSPISKNVKKYRLPRFALNDEFGDLKRFKLILNSRPLIDHDNTFNDTLINSETLEFSFKSQFLSESINCFVNNLASIEKKINTNYTVILKIKNLKLGKRYRINCTHRNEDGIIFWFGKMIKRIN